jgi:poly-gamma-glutamate capsule biosynthesis protein CapA/YwtB (metallophosphatase superfamily)
MSKRRLLLITLAVLLAGAAAGVFVLHKPKSGSVSQQTSEAKTEQLATEPPSRIRLIATGDMLPHDSINQQAKTADGYDYKPYFTEVKKYFDGADVRFCNQEATSSGGSITGYPSFNAPEQFARDLSAVGCNVVSLANNHMNDRGQAGIDKTVNLWEELKSLAFAGANRSAAEKQEVRYFEVKGVKFAFVAYAEYSNNSNYTAHGLNILNESLVLTQLSEARKEADIVIVSAHWGTEYSPAANAFQERWSNTFAGLGADIVLGTGPHVLQPVKKLPRAGGGETIVWFSLGNMLSTQLDIESLIGGFAVVDIDPSSKKVTDLSFLPTYMHYEWTADEKAREDLLKRKNLKLYPLDLATEPLARSQNNTTVEAQTERVRKLLSTFTPVTILTSKTF